MTKEVIPRKTVYRLSLYHRILQRLQANQVPTVSSENLAKTAGVKPTQLRKDLAYFGQMGTRGLGYNVELLVAKLDQVLGTTRLQPVALLGVGDLGSALLKYQGFAREGFEIVVGFDIDPHHRAHRGAVPILPMHRLAGEIRERTIKMAILTVPATHAQAVANQLVEVGIQAILNFAPIILQVPEQVVVNNVDLALELENLSYFIR